MSSDEETTDTYTSEEESESELDVDEVEFFYKGEYPGYEHQDEDQESTTNLDYDNFPELYGAHSVVEPMHVLSRNITKQDCHIHFLDLHSATMSEEIRYEDYVTLYDALKKNTSIRELNLITDQYIEIALEAIGKNEHITNLKLRLGREWYRRIPRSVFCRLQDNSTITTLNLSFSRLRDSDVKNISSLLKNNLSNLTDLNLCSTGLSPEGLGYISDVLKTNTSIRKLNLSHNTLGNSSYLFLIEGIRSNSTLQNLNIGSTYLLREIAEIIKAINVNSSVHTLKVNDNKTGDRIMRYIFDELALNKSLHSLNLSCMGMTRRSLPGLIEIADRPNLRKLNISGNDISATLLRVPGYNGLYGAIEKSTSLEVLNIGTVEEEGRGSYMSIAGVLKTNTSIRKLTIDSDDSGGYISTMNSLKTNSTLRVLKIDKKLRSHEYFYLTSLLSKNTTIENIEFTDLLSFDSLKHIVNCMKINNSIQRFKVKKNYVADDPMDDMDFHGDSIDLIPHVKYLAGINQIINKLNNTSHTKHDKLNWKSILPTKERTPSSPITYRGTLWFVLDKLLTLYLTLKHNSMLPAELINTLLIQYLCEHKYWINVASVESDPDTRYYDPYGSDDYF